MQYWKNDSGKYRICARRFSAELRRPGKSSYSAGLKQLDFAKDIEAARKTINTWVEKETREKIPDLIGPGVLRDDTRLTAAKAAPWLMPKTPTATAMASSKLLRAAVNESVADLA